MQQHASNSDTTPIWLTIEQAADRAGCSIDTIRRAYLSGELRVTTLRASGTSPKRFRPEWIDAWMESRAVGGEQ